MHRTFFLSGLLLMSYLSNSQTDSYLIFENRLIEHFLDYNMSDNKVTSSSLYKTHFTDNNFNVSIAKDLIDFETKQVVIVNPYFLNKYEESEEDNDYVKKSPGLFL